LETIFAKIRSTAMPRRRVLANGGLLEGHLGACQHAIEELMIAAGSVGSRQP
jgi:hypothetical protein